MDSVTKKDTELIFVPAFGESWHGEILGQVKLNSKSPFTVEADWFS